MQNRVDKVETHHIALLDTQENLEDRVMAVEITNTQVLTELQRIKTAITRIESALNK